MSAVLGDQWDLMLVAVFDLSCISLSLNGSTPTISQCMVQACSSPLVDCAYHLRLIRECSRYIPPIIWSQARRSVAERA